MSSGTHGNDQIAMNVEEQVFNFPPFPTPREGATIVPFSEFVPRGYTFITDLSGQTIEVDVWAGIPTIKVLNEQEAAQRRKSKKKRRNAGTAKDATGRLIPWWEEWEEGEATRAMSQASFDSNMSLEDRVCLAADDFRVGRMWPEIGQGVRLLWDQFRLYIGLIASIPIYKKVKSKPKGQVDGPNEGKEASDEDEDTPRASQTKVDIVQDNLEQSALPGKQLEPSPDRSTLEAQRLCAFVDDMEKTVKVFLSSYMRHTGLIWTDKNLFIAPTVLHFFLRFMLRNGVFADSGLHLDNLRHAVPVAALAQKELPLTAKHGRIFPGQFDLACKECWGTKGNLTIHISATVGPTSSDTTPFETELKEQDVEVVPSDVVLDSITAKHVMEDNLDEEHQHQVADDPWTPAIQAEEYTTASWTDVFVPCLMQILGPSVFPLTMATGVVEFSTRRIRDVVPPGVSSEARKASVVEKELEKRFFRVVLSPWVRSASEETADFPRPVVVSGSRSTEGVDDCNIENTDDGAWNAYRDDVTILVDGEIAEDLVVGMGLCGTWVEMVPNDMGESEGHARGCYWYMESLVASFPSYYTEGDMIGEVVGDEDEE